LIVSLTGASVTDGIRALCLGNFYDALGDSLGVVELPKGEFQSCQINGLGYAINKDTKNFDASWEFMQFIMSQEGQAATSAVVIPAYEGAADAWLATYPTLDLQVFLDATSYGVAEYPFLKNTRQARQILIDHVSAINMDPSVDIQAELDAAQAECAEVLK
jgi:ABC-type glycerol-3-phosphate transport system substrate-binding protein